MTQSTFDRWLLGAGGLVALLVVSAVLTFQNTQRLHEDAGWVDHTHEVMDAREERLRQMDEMERNLLRDRSEKRAQTYRSTLITGLLSGVAAVTGVVAFMWLLRRHLAARTTAEAVIAEQRERLRTTLASIG